MTSKLNPKPKLRHRVFVIGMGDYVEFRSSTGPLHTKVCTYVKTNIVDGYKYEQIGEPAKLTRVPAKVEKKLRMQQTVYLGGKTLGYCPRYDAMMLGIVTPNNNGIYELPPSQAKLALSCSWRKNHLTEY